jgi:hypothetical protein
MKGFVATICASILILTVPSLRPAYALTPQQELMKICNTQAGNQKLTGDARKSFMSDCLSGKASTTLNTPAGADEIVQRAGHDAEAERRCA